MSPDIKELIQQAIDAAVAPLSVRIAELAAVPTAQPYEPLWDVDASAEYLDISKPSFWNGVRDGRLPKPLYPTSRTPRWVPSEIRDAAIRTRAMPCEQAATRAKAKRIAV